MKSPIKTLAPGLVSAMFSAVISAGELKTDWIEPVEGYEEATLGARVQTLEISPVDGSTTATISIPRIAVDENGTVEEVIIYGKGPDKTEPRVEIPHEWVSDYDKDNYGLILYLGKNANIPLRLYLKGQ
jgi:hypothetical protein